jgi:hypothetical protein
LIFFGYFERFTGLAKPFVPLVFSQIVFSDH